MKFLHSLIAIPLAILILIPQLAMAGDGHDHGGAAPTVTGPALPRFAAVSDLFELVGVLNGKQITLYLDRAADNSPVTEAQIELEIGGKKFKAAKQGTDEFEVVLAEAPQPGVLPITATTCWPVNSTSMKPHTLTRRPTRIRGRNMQAGRREGSPCWRSC
jgi:hypothetical protein